MHRSMDAPSSSGWLLSSSQQGHYWLMTNTHPVVRVRNLHKRCGSVTALDGVGFDIHRGETFAYPAPAT